MTLKPLNEKMQRVLETIQMRLSEREALAYLQGTGIQLKRGMYYAYKRRLEKTKLERLHFIAAIGFESQHLQRIDTCELIDKLMWQNYHQCQDAHKRVMILKEIKELQPYISSYYEATKDVISGSNGRRQENTSISEDRIQQSITDSEAVF